MQILLPVSGARVDVRPPSGADDLFLREASRLDRAVAVQFVARLAPGIAVEELTVHDFEVLLLEIRCALLGDRLLADVECSCGQQVDVEFTIRAYLDHNRPRPAKQAGTAGRTGWYAEVDGEVEFRLPTIRDQVEVAREPEPWRRLAERCVRPAGMAPRVDRVMRAMAPPLSNIVRGTCPHCRRSTRFALDVPVFVLTELRTQTALVFDDVHLIASRYQWTEEYILGLPRARRERYAEMIRADRGLN